MAKTASMYVRIDPDVKTEVENVYSRYGISLSEAINMFIYQSLNIGGLPFELRPSVPNEETLAAIDEGNRIIEEIEKTGKGRFSNAADLIRSLKE